jgi:phosphonate transport system substrate-binding protein
MRTRNVLLAAAMLLAAITVPTSLQADEKKLELTFAVIQTEDMSVLAGRWEPILKYLDKKANIKVSFYATTSYSAVIEAMLSGFVQIAQLGPKAYLIANEKSKGKIHPIVAAARVPTAFDPTPCACYYGTLITRANSGLDSIDKLKGKVLALVDPGSTSGNALPRGLFTTEKLGGKDLEDHFGRIFYSGHHVASVLAVKKGQADAAFVSESMIARAMDREKVKKEEFNYLWRSPKIAIDSICVDTSKVTQETIDKIRAAYLAMHEDPEGQKILAAAKYSRFDPSDDSTYDPLRKVLEAKARMKKSGG